MHRVPRVGGLRGFLRPGPVRITGPGGSTVKVLLGRPIEGRNPGDAITVTMTNGYGSQLTRRVMRVDVFRGCNLCLPVQGAGYDAGRGGPVVRESAVRQRTGAGVGTNAGPAYPLFTHADPRVPVRLLLGPRQTVVAPRFSWSPASREARCRRCASSRSGTAAAYGRHRAGLGARRRDGLRPGAAHRAAAKRTPGCSCCSRFLPRRKRTRSCSGSRMRRRSS